VKRRDWSLGIALLLTGLIAPPGTATADPDVLTLIAAQAAAAGQTWGGVVVDSGPAQAGGLAAWRPRPTRILDVQNWVVRGACPA
jgi:hypothetical protein